MPRIDPILRRQEIIEVSRRLFQRHGFDSVRVDDILAETGLSKGGFYHHFKSREDVLRQIVADETACFVAGAEEAQTDSDSISALARLFADGSVQLGADAGILPSLASFAARTVYLDELERQFALRLHPIVSSLIEEGVASKAFRKVDSKATAEIFLAVNNYANRAALLGNLTARELQAYNQTAIEALARLLGIDGILQDRIATLTTTHSD